MTKVKGFTLVEVLIVVVILGILAAIAFPAYQDQAEQGHLSEGRSALTEVASQMERCFTRTGNYQNCDVKSASENGTYTISVNAPGDGTFTATAQRAKVEATNKCGDLTISHTGQKGVTNAQKTADECW